jgi:hypothetical protein
LLRILFLRHGAVSVGADGAALRVSGVGSSMIRALAPGRDDQNWIWIKPELDAL